MTGEGSNRGPGARFLRLCDRRYLGRNILLTWLALGLIALCVSWLLDLSDVTVGKVVPGVGPRGWLDLVRSRPSQKQVGFPWSVNWSGLIIILPIFLWGVASLPGKSIDLLRHLVRSGMLVREREGGAIEPIHSDQSLRANLAASLRFPLVIWLILSAGGVAFSIKQWHVQSYLPNQRCHQAAAPAECIHSLGAEADWATAAALRPEMPPTRASGFSLAVFVLGQAVMISAALLFLLYTINFCWFLMRLQPQEEPGQAFLLPDLNSSDSRAGFERFEDLGLLVVALATLIYVQAYLSILQNEYLMHGRGDILHFLAPTGRNHIFETITASGVSTTFLVPGVIIVLCLSLLLLPCLILAYTARTARDRRFELAAGPEARLPLTDDERKSLAGMALWPYSWLSLNRFWLFLALGLAGLVCFRIFPYLFAVLIGAIVMGLARRLRAFGGEVTGAGSGNERGKGEPKP